MVKNKMNHLKEQKMKILISIFLKWLPLAVLSAGLCGLVYVAVQQSLRMNGNDPQIQIAEDTAAALSAGTNIEALMPAQNVDIAESLAPFMIIYDGSGKIKASNAKLHGVDPVIPAGVLDSARQNGENRVTWQPESGVRIAAVIAAYHDGYVLSGRSLRETEKREDQTQFLSGAALAAIWAATFVLIALLEIMGKRFMA
jgi:hypothetical protein